MASGVTLEMIAFTKYRPRDTSMRETVKRDRSLRGKARIKARKAK